MKRNDIVVSSQQVPDEEYVVVSQFQAEEKEYEIYKLGDFKLKSGSILPNAHIAYKTFGNPQSPAIIYLTWFSGSISDNEWLIGNDKTLNPSEYFIVIPALFGNGQSSSPSNSPSPESFPDCHFYDNVVAQHTLLTKHLGINHARAVLGWSLGADQAYQWATQYPDFMDLVVPFCGTAKTSLFNQVFLEGVKSALLAAKEAILTGSMDGCTTQTRRDLRPWAEQEKLGGLKPFGRFYAAWGLSQAFYREKLFQKDLGFENLEEFLVNFWEAWACSQDPENLLAMLRTWQTGDCSNQEPYNGDFRKAMRGINAEVLVLSSKTDMVFMPEDSAREVAEMKPGVGLMLVIPSIWGHWAGGPGQSRKDAKWIDERLKWFFGRGRKCPRCIDGAKLYTTVEEHIQPNDPEVEASRTKVVQDELHTLPTLTHDIRSEIEVKVEVTLSSRGGSNTTTRTRLVRPYYQHRETGERKFYGV